MFNGNDFTGIWSLDPDTGRLDRLRPLSLAFVGLGLAEFGHFLAVVDDRLVLQMWPHFLEYELASWRLVRRYPPAAGLQPVGWSIEGPVLSESDATALGLQPGINGFVRCSLEMYSGGVDWLPRYCEPFQFPGWPEPLHRGADSSALLSRSVDPSKDRLSFVSRTPEHDHFGFPPVLTFDPEGGGIWRAQRQLIEFLPVSNGEVQPAALVHEPDFWPFGPDLDEDSRFTVFHRQAKSGRFFGVARGRRTNYLDAVFFGLDQDLSLLRTYDLPRDEDRPYGWPTAIASVGAPPTTTEQTIPVVSRTRGRNDTSWSSDLWLYNPSAEAMAVHIRRVTRPEEERTVSLPAHGSVRITDALSWIGGGPEGDGTKNDALVLTSPSRWGEELVAVSRTFSPDPDGGSYGQAVPAVPGRVGYSNHLPYDEDGSMLSNAQLPGTLSSYITLDRRTPGAYRHNLGVVNDGDQPVTLTLVWAHALLYNQPHRDSRPPETQQHVTVSPHRVKIVNLETLFPAAIRDGWPPRIAVFGDRPVLLWLSMVDNLTGDATLVPYTNFYFMVDSKDDRSVLPVVAHTPGKLGSFWVTDLYGYMGNDPGSPEVDASVTFLPADRVGQCGGAALDGEIRADYLEGELAMPLDVWLETWTATFGGHPSEDRAKDSYRTIFPDVIHLFPECQGEQGIKGALEIATGSWTSGYSRTYTTRSDGGTYGGMLPLYPPNGWPVQHFAGIEVGGEFRINLGFFNGDHEHTITHRVTLYRADGEEVASTEFDLAPLRLKQQSIERVLGLAKGVLEPGTYALTVLPLDDEETGVQGRSWAFVSLVENTTGDPTNWW